MAKVLTSKVDSILYWITYLSEQSPLRWYLHFFLLLFLSSTESLWTMINKLIQKFPEMLKKDWINEWNSQFWFYVAMDAATWKKIFPLFIPSHFFLCKIVLMLRNMPNLIFSLLFIHSHFFWIKNDHIRCYYIV